MNNFVHWNVERDLNLIEKELSKGKVLLAPSDTVLGLFAAISREGFEALNYLKGRFEKPYIVVLGDVKQVSLFADHIPSIGAQRLIESAWPGPLTLILPARTDLPDFAASKQRSIALRIPDHEAIRLLASRLGGLFSTSANKAGQPVPQSFKEIDQDLLAQVSYIIEEKSFSAIPSTIVDCTTSEIKVIREGAFPIARINEVISGSQGL